MSSWLQILLLVHLVGLAAGVGAATVKLALLLKATSDASFVPVYLQVSRPIARFIILGLIVLTVSGIGWLVQGYPFTGLLIVKLVLVGVVWVLGPVIDNVAEPRFRELAPAAGEAVSPDFRRARRFYLALESTATGLFYAVVVVWVLR